MAETKTSDTIAVGTLEKSPVRSDHEEDATQKLHQEALDDDPEFTYAEQRKIIHKIDRRLILMTGVMYMVSLMDRSNLPNAAISNIRRVRVTLEYPRHSRSTDKRVKLTVGPINLPRLRTDEDFSLSNRILASSS